MRLLAASLVLVAFALPAAAQDEDADQEEIILYHPPADSFITVLASGDQEPLSHTGVLVSVFDREDIEQVQGPDITRLLQRAPGVSLTRNGGPGAFTALRVRGSEAEQVLVLVDGVRVADPAAPGASFDMGTLMAGSLAKVELQRSSNSTIWGSQALAGVLAVTTAPKPSSWSQWPESQGILEYGSHNSFYATASAMQEAGPVRLSASGGWRQSDGFSSAAAGTEPDGHRQLDLAARATAELTGSLSAFAQVRLADARLDIDGFPAPDYQLGDTAEVQDSRQLANAVGLNWYGDNIQLHLTGSQARTSRTNVDPASGSAPLFTSQGTSRRVDLRGSTGSVITDWQVHFGGDYEWQAYRTLFEPRRATGAGGAYVQVDYDQDGLYAAAGVRRDQHEDFGGEWSVGGDLNWIIDQGLTVSASFGEGFKAPSLFQLHSDFGNASLQPERARSLDAGFWVEPGEDMELAVTLFRRVTRGQIAYVSCFRQSTGICAERPNGTYGNIDRARSQGVEAEGELQVVPGLDLRLAYAFTTSTNRATGNRLARRPRHAGTVSLDWQVLEALSLGADMRVVSGSFDDAANTVALGGHVLLDLRANWSVSEHFDLYGRIENAWDETYQTAFGYTQQGRAAFVGVRARL